MDSVPLEAFSGRESGEPRLKVSNLKLIAALFFIFLFIVSDVFTNNIISGFGEKAVRGRTLTTWGVVLQGIFLVIFYVIALYLIEHKII